MNAFGVKPCSVTNLPGIYLIISQTRYYIGSSVRLRDRMKSHSTLLNQNKHGNHFLQRAYNKYGKLRFVPIKIFAKNPDWSKKQLESVVRSEEQKYLLKCEDCKLCMNLRFDVNDPPDTSVPIISFDRLGKSICFESSIAAARFFNMSHFCISNILKNKSNISRGLTFFYQNSSEKDWKAKFGIKGRGSKSRIKAIDVHGNVLEFCSQRDASKALNVKSQSINRALKGGRKTAGKYRFEYS